MDLLWIASLKLIIFTDIRTIKGLKTKMSGFDVFIKRNAYIDPANVYYGDMLITFIH